MKVQCLNSSSIKTRNLIKKTFAELINEKKQLSKITVSELVKKANLTRSTFYTHYDNIYQVAEEYQMQTVELLCNEDLILNTKQDILNYFDNIYVCLKENEDTYKLLLNAKDSLPFLYKLKNIASDKIYKALINNSNDNCLDHTISFFMDGMILEIIKYFKSENNYTLKELFDNIKIWFNNLFY